MVYSKEEVLKRILRYYKLNDSIIRKAGSEYIDSRNVEEANLVLNSSKRISEDRKRGLILLNIFMNDANDIIVSKFNMENKGQYNFYLQNMRRYDIEDFKKLEKIVMLANKYPSVSKHLKHIDIRYVDYCENFIKYIINLNSEEEKEIVTKAFYGENQVSFLKLFDRFYEKIEKLPELRRIYALYLMTDNTLLDKMGSSEIFKNILDQIIISKEELSKYIFLAFKNTNLERENFMDYIKEKIKELDEFSPNMYDFGFNLLFNRMISKRKDRKEVLKYFQGLSFENISEEQQRQITNLATNSDLLLEHTKNSIVDREDYLDKIKFLVEYILTSKTFKNKKDHIKANKILNLATKEKLLKNTEYKDLIKYFDTLSEEDLNYASNRVMTLNMNTFINLKKLLKLPFIERDALHCIMMFFEKYVYQSKFLLGDKVEKEIESLNKIIDFVIDTPKKDRSKIYKVLASSNGEILYSTSCLDVLKEIQNKEEDARNKAYNIAAQIVEGIPYHPVDEKKKIITQELIKLINFLLEVPEDRFKLTLDVVLKTAWSNKLKLGKLIASYSYEEQLQIFKIIINYINQYKDEEDLEKRIDSRLKEQEPYELGCKLFLNKKENIE